MHVGETDPHLLLSLQLNGIIFLKVNKLHKLLGIGPVLIKTDSPQSSNN